MNININEVKKQLKQYKDNLKKSQVVLNVKNQLINILKEMKK